MSGHQTPRVLVIDDHEAIHEDFRKILGHWSDDTSEIDELSESVLGSESARRPGRARFEVDCAHQGEVGVRILEERRCQGKRFSLAFVDMQMPPGWDGLRTIQELWKRDPGLHVVICTAYSDRSWDEIVAVLGTGDRLLLLRKPFDPNEVWQVAVSISEKVKSEMLARQRMDKLNAMAEELQAANSRLQTEIDLKGVLAESLKDSAERDPLTGILNRRSLRERAQSLSNSARLPSRSMAAIYVDLDDFKSINDTYGHDAGDRYLVGFASALKSAGEELRALEAFTDVEIYRIGGDEFAVILVGILDHHDLDRAVRTILALNKMPVEVGGDEVHISLSVGASHGRGRNLHPEALLREADEAMYRAKARGKGAAVIFDEQMRQDLDVRLAIDKGLQTAGAESDFVVVYQPIVDPCLGEVASLEALLRWPATLGEPVPPDQFIPVAEKNGTILGLGRLVLRRACIWTRAWNASARDGRALSVNVNVSRRQLQTQQFLEDLDQILEETSLPPSLLRLEVTESALIDSPETLIRRVIEIRQRGVRIHLDDFGTGYSSLSCLHKMPLDGVKVDHSFVTQIATRPESFAVLQCIISLCHQLGMVVTVEGIENREQARRIEDLGCDLAQGYYYARPATDDAVLKTIDGIRRRMRAVREVEDRLVGSRPADRDAYGMRGTRTGQPA